MSGCVDKEPVYQPIARDLPPRETIIQSPAPRPRISQGEDLGVIAGKWRGVAIENETRLILGGDNYEILRADMAAVPLPEPRPVP